MLPRAQADEVRKLAARTDAFLEAHFVLDRGWLAWAAQLLQDCAVTAEADSGTGTRVTRLCIAWVVGLCLTPLARAHEQYWHAMQGVCAHHARHTAASCCM